MHKNGKARIKALKELVRRVATITTALDTPGLKLRFIDFEVDSDDSDSDGAFDDVRTVRDVTRALARVKFRGKRTQLGMGLQRKVLEPLLFAKIESGELTRPVLVTTITDGAVGFWGCWVFGGCASC